MRMRDREVFKIFQQNTCVTRKSGAILDSTTHEVTQMTSLNGVDYRGYSHGQHKFAVVMAAPKGGGSHYQTEIVEIPENAELVDNGLGLLPKVVQDTCGELYEDVLLSDDWGYSDEYYFLDRQSAEAFCNRY